MSDHYHALTLKEEVEQIMPLFPKDTHFWYVMIHGWTYFCKSVLMSSFSGLVNSKENTPCMSDA